MSGHNPTKIVAPEEIVAMIYRLCDLADQTAVKGLLDDATEVRRAIVTLGAILPITKKEAVR